MHEEFVALAQGACDYSVAVIAVTTKEYGTMMTICATEEAVYITKEQAMKFFGLVDPSEA